MPKVQVGTVADSESGTLLKTVGRARPDVRVQSLGDVTHSSRMTGRKGLGRGTVRGTTRGIIPAQPVPSMRCPVSSVQLARMVHEAVLLVNGRPAVRTRSPAPSSEGVRTRHGHFRGTVKLDKKGGRHYAASQLLAGGFDLRNTAARLGHSGGDATTLRHYADPVPEVNRRAAAYLAQLTARSTPSSPQP
jgi:hypothetical protein